MPELLTAMETFLQCVTLQNLKLQSPFYDRAAEIQQIYCQNTIVPQYLCNSTNCPLFFFFVLIS